jgi:hypothetical protein
MGAPKRQPSKAAPSGRGIGTMSTNAPSTQHGDRSINVGRADFRGANVHVGDSYSNPPQITLARTQPTRVLRWSLGRKSQLGLFSLLGTVASIVGLYFTLFPLFSSHKQVWLAPPVMAVFLAGVAAVFLYLDLGKRKFISLGRLLCLELSSKDRVFVTRLTGTCPWCGSRMDLGCAGRLHWLVCRRNPAMHVVPLDSTELPPVE